MATSLDYLTYDLNYSYKFVLKKEIKEKILTSRIRNIYYFGCTRLTLLFYNCKRAYVGIEVRRYINTVNSDWKAARKFEISDFYNMYLTYQPAPFPHHTSPNNALHVAGDGGDWKAVSKACSSLIIDIDIESYYSQIR